VTINTTNQLVFTVQNTGGGALTGNVGTLSVPFSLIGAGTNYVLAAGASTNVTIRFAPVTAGLYSNNIAFNSNGGNLLRPVTGTPFDFTQAHKIGERITQADEQLKFGGGYDHNWVLDKPTGALEVIARVSEPTSGRILEVLSTEPGLQFYSGNFLDGTNIGKGGKAYQFRTGFCMEPQHFPDSPNQPQFPSVVLKKGQTYKNTIIFRFSAK